MRVISWEIWMWLSRTPLSFPVEQHAQLWSLGCIPAWHGTGWGVLLCAQLSWKPVRRIRVSFRSVLAPEQWLLAMWMSSDWRGTWPPGQRDLQKHEGREKNQMVLRWWVSRSITWAGFLPSHRAGQLTEKGFSIVCLDNSELLLPSSGTIFSQKGVFSAIWPLCGCAQCERARCSWFSLAGKHQSSLSQAFLSFPQGSTGGAAGMEGQASSLT